MDKAERAELEQKVDILTRPDFVAGWKEMEQALTSLIKNCEQRIVSSWDDNETLRLKLLRKEAVRLVNMPRSMVQAIRDKLNAATDDTGGDPVLNFIGSLADVNSEATANFAGSTGVKQEE